MESVTLGEGGIGKAEMIRLPDLGNHESSVQRVNGWRMGDEAMACAVVVADGIVWLIARESRQTN